MTIPQDSISIVIPAKNEEKTIADIVKSALNYSNDVLVIDGNSIDKTAENAKSVGARVINIHPKGKGHALCSSIEYIKNPDSCRTHPRFS